LNIRRTFGVLESPPSTIAPSCENRLLYSVRCQLASCNRLRGGLQGSPPSTIRALLRRRWMPEPRRTTLHPDGRPSRISRCCGDDGDEFFDRAVEGITNCPGRAVHLLHRAFGGQRRVLTLDLPDLRHCFLHPRNRRLRASAEGAPPKVCRKLPAMSLRPGHLAPSGLVSPGLLPGRQWIVSAVQRSRCAQ
jgi:hypothetical protein